MQWSRIRKNWILKTSLICLMMQPLTACQNDSDLHRYCPAIVLTAPEVKAWLHAQEPLPEYVNGWINDIRKQQLAIMANCSN